MAQIAVFVRRGKRGWKFDAYSQWFHPSWDGCNIVEVPESVPRKDRKAHAINSVRVHFDMESKIAPTGFNVCKDLE